MQKLASLLKQSPSKFYKSSSLHSKLKSQPFSTWSYKLDDFLLKLRYPLYYYLISANVGVFAAYKLGFISEGFFRRNFALSSYSIDTHRYHTILTHGFAHMGLMHLAFNMVGLYFFGQFIERAFGSRRLFNLYMGGVLTGALFIMLQNSKRKNSNSMALHIGASTGVSSILAYFILNFPHQQIILYFIPVPAWLVGVLLFGQSIMFYDSYGGVSHSGHLGGLMFGTLYHFYLRRRLL